MTDRATLAAVTSCRVIFADTDAGGIVYHPRYLEMAERGRNELMRSVGLDLGELFEQRRLGLVLRSVAMKFYVPALFDDHLVVRTSLARLGAASSTWVSHICRGGTLLCVVRAEIVCLDRFSGRPILHPGDLQFVFERAQSGTGDHGPEGSR